MDPGPRGGEPPHPDASPESDRPQRSPPPRAIARTTVEVLRIPLALAFAFIRGGERPPESDRLLPPRAIARTVGWVAHWNEMIEDPSQKIGRPRQLYVGPERRDFVPIGER